MIAFFGAALAGALTALSPCVLPVLPVVVLGSAGRSAERAPRRRAVLVTVGLGASVFSFTILLKATTVLAQVPSSVWPMVSGCLLVLIGVFAAFPGLWTAMIGRLGLEARAGARLARVTRLRGDAGALLTGAALGPVFSSCSPLYGYVVVTVLPANLGYGLILLVAYAVGLMVSLLVLALSGQGLVRRLGWAVDAHSVFRRAVGAVFVAVGAAVLLGLDRTAQTWIIEYTPFAPWLLEPAAVGGAAAGGWS